MFAGSTHRSGGPTTYSWRQSDACRWHCIADDEKRTIAGAVIRLGHARYQIRLRQSDGALALAPRLAFDRLKIARRFVEVKLKSSVTRAG